MPTGFSDYLANKVITHVFGGVNFTPPTNFYVALFTTAPGLNGSGGVEVITGGYTRKAVTYGTVSGRMIASNLQVEFTATGGPLGDIKAIGIYDAITDGNLLVVQEKAFGEFLENDTLRIPVGSLINSIGFVE
mgnify:CR=1 FL=1